jgi:hypothetical protein
MALISTQPATSCIFMKWLQSNETPALLFLASETQETMWGEHFSECGKEPPFRCYRRIIPPFREY